MNLVNRSFFDWARSQYEPEPKNLNEIIYQITSLPGLANWIPSGVGSDFLELANFAACTAKIDPNSCKKLIEKVSNLIKTKHDPDSSIRAELYAAALLKEWATSLIYIPESSSPTPDFLAIINGNTYELEVTSSKEKEEQILRKGIAHQLSKKLLNENNISKCIVRLSDTFSKNDINDVMIASKTLAEGDFIQENEKWYIMNLGNSNPPNPNSIPEWAFSKYATPALFSNSFEITLGENNNLSIPSKNDIQWILSTKSYLNSLSKKQEAKQASGNFPFFILCDVTHLPGAFKWYEEHLEAFLPSWNKKISGVLFMDRAMAQLAILEINYMLIKNLSSDKPLSKDFKIKNRGKICIEAIKF